jgi:hypothetical protein
MRFFGYFMMMFVFFTACKKNKTEPAKPISGINYFPILDSATWIYKVDSIVFNSFQAPGTAPDTSVYWIKESIVEDLSDLIDLSKKRIERYISTDSGINWKFDRSLVVIKNNIQAIRNDYNIMEFKLSFPITELKSWNGNQFNNLGEKEYLYDWIFLPYKTMGQNQDSSIKVLHRNVKNQIRDNIEYEIYLPNIGLVYKEIVDLNYKDLGRTKVDGRIVKYNLISFNEK